MLEKYKNSQINQIGEQVQKYLDENKLDPKGKREFRLLNGHLNTDHEKFGGEKIFNSSIGVPLNGYIIDPDKGPIQVAVVKSFDPKTELPIFKKFIIKTKRKDVGIFRLHGNIVDDIRVHDALLLSNYNGTNPFRDTSVNPIFETINEGAESQQRSKKRHFLKDCLNAIDSWTDNEIKAIGASYSVDPKLEVSVIKDKLEQMAEKDPINFYKNIDTEETAIRGLIQLAKSGGLISYNAVEKKWFFTSTNETIALLQRKEGVSEIAQLAEFLKSAANGPAVRKNIENMLKHKN